MVRSQMLMWNPPLGGIIVHWSRAVMFTLQLTQDAMSHQCDDIEQ
jgi:hypothetical protein